MKSVRRVYEKKHVDSWLLGGMNAVTVSNLVHTCYYCIVYCNGNRNGVATFSVT